MAPTDRHMTKIAEIQAKRRTGSSPSTLRVEANEAAIPVPVTSGLIPCAWGKDDGAARNPSLHAQSISSYMIEGCGISDSHRLQEHLISAETQELEGPGGWPTICSEGSS